MMEKNRSDNETQQSGTVLKKAEDYKIALAGMVSPDDIKTLEEQFSKE